MNNLQTLRQAIKYEPMEEILSNLEKYVEDKHTFSDKNRYEQKKMQQFFAKLNTVSLDHCHLFVSHEATRTGAPLIVHQIAKELQDLYDIQPIFILCKGGEIGTFFSSQFPSYFLQHGLNPINRNLELKQLFRYFQKHISFENIWVNSAESRFILPTLNKYFKVNKTVLLHEMGNLYPKNAWNGVNLHADQIVFPANFIKTRAIQNHEINEGKTFVRGQGLLRSEMLKIDFDYHREPLRTRLGIPNDGIIVLACGSTIMRKGVDIFNFVAISTLQKYGNQGKLYFVWLGDAPANYIQRWIMQDRELSGWSEHILFPGAVDDPIPYFMGSDMFLMVSRGDPFPCVVHEAMAAGLPILGFHGTGGYQEKAYAKNMFMHDFGDISKMCENIVSLSNNIAQLKNMKSPTRAFVTEHLNFRDYVLDLYKIAKYSKQVNQTDFILH